MRNIVFILWVLVFPASWAFGQTSSFTLTLSNGFSAISNPYNSGSNTVAELFGNVPEGTRLYTLDASTQLWRVNQFQFGNWVDPAQQLPPGLGAFICNPTNPFSITFTGTAPTNFPIAIYEGYNLIGWWPTSSPPAQCGDIIYHPLRGYAAEYFCPGWELPPRTNLAEAFFYIRGTNTPLPSVYLNNYLPSYGIDAFFQSTFGCIGSNMVAQLYYGTNANYLQPLGDPLPVRELSPGKGYIDTRNGAVRELPAGGSYYFQIRFMDLGGSPTPCFMGSSAVFHVTVYGVGTPTTLSLWNSSPVWVGPLSPFPVWRYPSNTTVLAGQNAQFVATMLSDCGYTFQWQRELNPDQWVDLSGKTSTNLFIQSSQAIDAGAYRLVITHGCTNRILEKVILNVLTPRPILQQPQFVSNGIELSVAGESNFNYAIEYSENLIQWTNLTFMSNAPAVWSVQDSNVFKSGRRFYRARVLP